MGILLDVFDYLEEVLVIVGGEARVWQAFLFFNMVAIEPRVIKRSLKTFVSGCLNKSRDHVCLGFALI